MSEILENSKKAADFIKLLSNQTRLIVLCSIIEKPLCVSDLVEITQISQSALSQHLTKMAKENIIEGKRDGNQIFYSIKDPNINKIIHALHDIFCKK
ncbi:metalloregulator ArsR/SmtB family transcription factor [Rickettsiales bacterium]|nr:metalloregulator ArsR/SmtB family transcription factor [Rickettsiales bacterium]